MKYAETGIPLVIIAGKEYGTVTAVQTFGNYGRWHPHLHLLVADGLFMPNGIMPDLGLKSLQELFRAEDVEKGREEAMSAQNVSKAGEVARGVPGIKRVQNDLIVK